MRTGGSSRPSPRTRCKRGGPRRTSRARIPCPVAPQPTWPRPPAPRRPRGEIQLRRSNARGRDARRRRRRPQRVPSSTIAASAPNERTKDNIRSGAGQVIHGRACHGLGAGCSRAFIVREIRPAARPTRAGSASNCQPLAPRRCRSRPSRAPPIRPEGRRELAAQGFAPAKISVFTLPSETPRRAAIPRTLILRDGKEPVEPAGAQAIGARPVR